MNKLIIVFLFLFTQSACAGKSTKDDGGLSKKITLSAHINCHIFSHATNTPIKKVIKIDKSNTNYELYKKDGITLTTRIQNTIIIEAGGKRNLSTKGFVVGLIDNNKDILSVQSINGETIMFGYSPKNLLIDCYRN